MNRIALPSGEERLSPVASLGAQLRALRLQRGWNMDRVAREAHVSRTTLFHLERGEIRRPRASTLHKLAALFEIPVESFSTTAVVFPEEERPSAVRLLQSRSPLSPRGRGVGGEGASVSDVAIPSASSAHASELADPQRQFDRNTNPIVTEVARNRPELFCEWSLDDWDELYSQFGVGGALTEEGVHSTATRINLNRETLYRLRIVLQTHLASVAVGLVETLYQQVCVDSGGSAGPEVQSVIDATNQA